MPGIPVDAALDYKNPDGKQSSHNRQVPQSSRGTVGQDAQTLGLLTGPPAVSNRVTDQSAGQVDPNSCFAWEISQHFLGRAGKVMGSGPTTRETARCYRSTTENRKVIICFLDITCHSLQ